MLNYLRDKSLVLPSSETSLKELKREADYYCLAKLSEMINDEIRDTQKSKAMEYQKTHPHEFAECKRCDKELWMPVHQNQVCTSGRHPGKLIACGSRHGLRYDCCGSDENGTDSCRYGKHQF